MHNRHRSDEYVISSLKLFLYLSPLESSVFAVTMNKKLCSSLHDQQELMEIRVELSKGNNFFFNTLKVDFVLIYFNFYF